MRSVMALAAALMLLPAFAARAAAPLADPPLRDADYLAFADGIVAGVNVDWDTTTAMYVSPGNGSAVRMNANLLVAHAVAALTGHQGASRQDERARALALTFTRSPSSRLARAAAHKRSICWTRDLALRRPDHVSADPQVAEALGWTWRARDALALPPADANRIARALERCARRPHWRFPYSLNNQFNWNAQLYAHAAAVSGRTDLLRRDYRRHLRRFVAGVRRPLPGTVSRNLGPGYAFRYSPSRPPGAGLNLDAPEYANIVASGLQHYPQALLAGMRPLPRADMRLLRAWVMRLLAGAWTHAGYLNWDTGHGHGRWHSGQYWAFAQQGLLAIAVAPQFSVDPAQPRWAKALFDRALLLYARWAREAGAPIAPRHVFGVHSEHLDYNLYATRMAANAARAVALGLGGMAAEDPPPLYAFDRDTGRLAVTTPRYSTAIVPDNRGAFRYGGIDLARLYGPGHRVAATIGGEPPAAFGARVRDAAGAEVLASQHAHARPGRLWVPRSPGDRAERGRPYAATPPAGPFGVVEARGAVRRGGLRITTRHRFRPANVDTRWDVRCRGRCGPYDVDVHLPTWGADTPIDAVRHDGTRVRLAGLGTGVPAPQALADVRRIELGGYTVTPATEAGVLTVVPTRPQPTATRPGPTLAIRLAGAARVRHLVLAVRIEPR